MACGHKVMLLLDTAGGAARQGRARRAALRLLAYLGCRFGLARVHWAFKFFDSQGARSRPSRACDFRELGARSWEDFEEELEARLGDHAHGSHLPGPASRAAHTHGALMETLLDYQWDRPEITSPTKPILRSRGRRLLDAESEAEEAGGALGGFANAVFLLAPCPHSHRELLQFLLGSEAQAERRPPHPKLLMDKLLPRRVQEVMIARNITLYWLDTTECAQLWESPDHVGYWTVCELLHHGGGTVLPSETFSWSYTKAGETVIRREGKPSSKPHLSPWISALPSDATLNRLLYNPPSYEASFPQIEGTLFFPGKGQEIQETWTVTLEPLAMHQRHFQKPVRIFLKGLVSQWSLPTCGSLGTDSWMLQSLEGNKSTQRLLFQQLVSELTTAELHLVASVDSGEGWHPITGVFSPLSANAAILTVFRAKEAEFQSHFLQAVVAEGAQDPASLVLDVVDRVLNQSQNSFEDPASSAPPVPEWAQQELGRTIPWSPAVVEKWFPFSNISGASSHLMESFWLLQAASANKEESSETESELTHCLSELYQRRSREEASVAGQEDRKKKRGIPRTPVRQKMNTMCRSLKMLNVARLNVKAQKLHPDGSPDVAGEKGTQKTAGGRTADRLEDRGRTLRSSKLKDFKTEEELLSYIHENYQTTVATEGILLYSCAQDIFSAIKVFLKSKGTKELEINFLNHIKNSLLKTNKSLQQSQGKKLDKEDRVREGQLQVFLRLEMCLQCPSVLESAEEMEQVVEEMADFLRMVCRAKDPAYLSEFLEEILRLYINSIPKTLGKLYDSLGFVIPPKLAGVLPTDFFSDDSMTQESKSPLSVPHSSSVHRSELGGTESDQLEELRTRSAKKRRKNALIRHKSIAEASQSRRQIEIPKVSKTAMKNESSQSAPQQPLPPGKDTGQEVTKVRRNLFTQKMLSPSKRSLKRGLPRSHSVSAVEGLDHKLDNFKKTKSTTFQGYHKLLTKSVAETPEHKQISRRLLYRQIKGRSSDPGPDVAIVEESPEKESEISLRRSPRIKQLSFSRTNSGSFYSASQPKSRSVQRAHLFQQDKPDQRGNSPVQSIWSPKRLLFGAVSEKISPSEKGSARIIRPSRSTLGSEIPTAYQTPKKSCGKSSSFSKITPRRFPRTPQTPVKTPERLQNSPAKMSPTKRAISKVPLKDPSTRSCRSPLTLKVTPQKGSSLAGEGASLKMKIPRTPSRPGAGPCGSSPNRVWPCSVNSSPESPSCPASPAAASAQPGSECLSPVPHSLRTPPRAAALLGTPENQTRQQPHLPRASETEGQAQKVKGTAVKTPKRLEDATVIPSPPVSPKKQFTSPKCDVSKSPLRKSLLMSPAAGELDWKEPQMSPSKATFLSLPVASTPHKAPQRATSNTSPPPPPSKLGSRWRKISPPQPQRGFPECQSGPSAATALDPAVAGSGEGQWEGSSSHQPSAGRSYLGAVFGSDLLPLGASDMEYLTLLSEAEHGGREGHEVNSGFAPREEGEGLNTVVAEEPCSVSDPRSPLPAPSTGPSPTGWPSHGPCGTADGRQHQATAQPPEAPGSPPTYEVELEMQASGLPKLRIKKIDPSALEKGSPREEGGASPVLSMPTDSQSSKPEPTHLSPPCLCPSHSTPGKTGGQTYICQSCTPSHCPSSTHSPVQTDGGVPWTPSPKQSGKATPDTIKDWPRRKRAVDCGTGSCVGRGEASADLPGALSLLDLEPKEKEQGLKLGLQQAPILEDFELEGVYRLPDQSPPRDSGPKVQEGFSWGQFGLGSRKRDLSVKEEAEHGAKRACEPQSEASDGSPGWRGPLLPSTGDDEVFASGSTPPPGYAARNCLSASGLQALTQSPLLFQGRTPSSQCKDTQDEDVDVFPSAMEESPFGQAFPRRRPFSRTYTRKKLIS